MMTITYVQNDQNGTLKRHTFTQKFAFVEFAQCILLFTFVYSCTNLDLVFLPKGINMSLFTTLQLSKYYNSLNCKQYRHDADNR